MKKSAFVFAIVFTMAPAVFGGSLGQKDSAKLGATECNAAKKYVEQHAKLEQVKKDSTGQQAR